LKDKRPLVEACCNSPVDLQLADQSLDFVPMGIPLLVKAGGPPPALWRRRRLARWL
jgi:hypothetical protein